MLISADFVAKMTVKRWALGVLEQNTACFGSLVLFKYHSFVCENGLKSFEASYFNKRFNPTLPEKLRLLLPLIRCNTLLVMAKI